MRIEPANLDQIRRAYDGSMIMIHADAGGVAAELKRIDPGLVVRFSERGRCWIVFYAHCITHPKHDPRCRRCRAALHEIPPQEDRPGIKQDLVLTVNATQSRLGIWTGLDQRVVDRIREINPEGPGRYDYAAALERASKEHAAKLEKERAESLEPLGELAAHAVRKDLGARYKGRTFVPKDIA